MCNIDTMDYLWCFRGADGVGVHLRNHWNTKGIETSTGCGTVSWTASAMDTATLEYAACVCVRGTNENRHHHSCSNMNAKQESKECECDGNDFDGNTDRNTTAQPFGERINVHVQMVVDTVPTVSLVFRHSKTYRFR